jgi:hypothetical protein
LGGLIGCGCDFGYGYGYDYGCDCRVCRWLVLCCVSESVIGSVIERPREV